MRILRNGLGSMVSLDQALIRSSWPSTNTALTTKTPSSITPKHQSGDPHTIGSNTPNSPPTRRRGHSMTRPERLVREPRWTPPTTVPRPQVSALEAAHSWSTLDSALQARDLIDHPVISAMSTSGNSHSDPWTVLAICTKTTAKENSTRPPTRWPSQERWGLLETPPLLINVTKIISVLNSLVIPLSILCKYRPRDPRYHPAKVRKTPGRLLPRSTRAKRSTPSPRRTVLTLLICITKTYQPSKECQKQIK